MVETKSIAKSVRLTPTTYKEIENYRGEGFNEKLGNLVDDYLNCKEDLRQEWERLNAAVLDKHAELRSIQAKVKKIRELDPRMTSFINALLDLLGEEC